MSYAYTVTRPTHLRLGTWTACGQKGVQHRALFTTEDPSRVSCKPCRRWMSKKEPPIA